MNYDDLFKTVDFNFFIKFRSFLSISTFFFCFLAIISDVLTSQNNKNEYEK